MLPVKNFLSILWIGLLMSIFSLTLISVEEAEAQWGIGASFELRDEDPSRGYGFRIERGVLESVPLLDLKTRFHYSAFSDDVDSFRDIDTNVSLDTWDIGLAALAGVNVGLIKPYGGAGIGRERIDATWSELEQVRSGDDSSFYWNLFLGAEVAPVPLIRPFIEYRFVRLFDDDGFDYRQNSRLAIGLSLSF